MRRLFVQGGCQIEFSTKSICFLLVILHQYLHCIVSTVVTTMHSIMVEYIASQNMPIPHYGMHCALCWGMPFVLDFTVRTDASALYSRHSPKCDDSKMVFKSLNSFI